MNLRTIGALAASAVLLSGCGSAANTVPPAQSGTAVPSALARELALGQVRPACGPAGANEVRCLSYVRTASGRSPLGASASATAISGYSPAQLQSAYNLTGVVGSHGSGKTVAIVVAYNDPDAAADLAVYRSTFGLPACTVASGCLTIVNGSGGSSLPADNASWSQETSLALDMVSANCPLCSILLVEAAAASTSDLAAAVNTAAAKGAVAIANPYGGAESSSELTYASSYSHAGVAITAAGGDDGYGISVPAAYATVAAVGGTTLTAAAGTARGWTETGLAGGGCSAYVAKPSFQTDPYCGSHRIDNDVAYDADPNTGVAVYDSYAYEGYSGWMVFGGTSVGTAAIAAIYALSGNTTGAPATLYSRASMLYHIPCISGSECYGTYDPATGNGTPDGIGAF